MSYQGEARWPGPEPVPVLGETVEIHVPEQTFTATIVGARRWAGNPEGVVIVAFDTEDEFEGFEARLA